MRYLTLLFLLLFIFCCSPASLHAKVKKVDNESVLIVKKKVVFIRKGKRVKEFPPPRRADISYPVVRGGLNNPAVLNKVRSLLRPKNIFGYSVEDYKDDEWLTEFDYRIHYNKNSILDITFTQSGEAAYPDSQSKHLAINLKTGTLIKAGDVFTSGAMATLAGMGDKKLQDEIKQILRDVERSTDFNADQKQSIPQMFEGLKFQPENLDEFSVSDKGITFLYDAGFPHVAQALQPVGRYFFSYRELKPYIKTDSILGRFIQ